MLYITIYKHRSAIRDLIKKSGYLPSAPAPDERRESLLTTDTKSNIMSTSTRPTSISTVYQDNNDAVPASYLRRVFSQVSITDNGDTVNLALPRPGYMDFARLSNYLTSQTPLAITHGN